MIYYTHNMYGISLISAPSAHSIEFSRIPSQKWQHPHRLHQLKICSSIVGVQVSSSLPNVKITASWKTAFKQPVPCVRPITNSFKWRFVPTESCSTGSLSAIHPSQQTSMTLKNLAMTLPSSYSFHSLQSNRCERATSPFV